MADAPLRQPVNVPGSSPEEPLRVENGSTPPPPAQPAPPLDEARDAALSLEARALDGGQFESAPEAAPALPQVLAVDEGSDSLILDLPETATPPPRSSRFRTGEWQHEFSAQKIAAELRRIEEQVRNILDERDPKRKRKFTGTRRWLELEEDIVAMRFSGRMDEDQLRTISRLIVQRHFLFRQLHFVSATRPTWNT